MKYLKIEAFEKHLEKALPDHSSSIYTLLMAEPDEREFVIKTLLMSLGEVEKKRIELKELEEAIASPSFLSAKRCLIVENLESENKTAFDSILPFLRDLPPNLTVILSGSALKVGPPFYEALKQEMVFLDLSQETPWDRKKRWQRWLLEAMRLERKQLAPDAAAYLLEAHHPSFSSLLREAEKAVTYVGKAKTISLDDLKAICHFKESTKGWELSEAMIWGGNISMNGIRALDSSDAMGLLGQLRYHIKLGLCIAEACLTKKEETLTQAYPNLRPKTFEKYKPIASRLTSTYFRWALETLFDTELKCRSGLKPPLLLEILTYKLSYKRKRAALSLT